MGTISTGGSQYMPPFIPNTDKAATMVGGYIDTVIMHADDAYLKAMELLNSLGQYAQFDVIDTDTGWTELSPPAIRYDIGTPPVKPTLGTIPSPPINFDYIESPYVSTLLDALKAKLLNDILNGGTGLSLAVENEIYARESERDVRGLSDTIDRIATRWSESGFSLPNGILTAMTSWADIEYQNKYSDKSRKIAEDSFKTAVDNTRFTIEQSGRLEDVLMRFNSESNKNKIMAAQAILEAGISIFDALIKEKLANVDLYKAEAQAYEANAKAIGAIAAVDVAIFDAQVGYNKARSDVAVKEIEMQIKQLEVQLQVTSDISRGVADVASRLAAGAMSAVNAGASLGYSGSDSNSSNSSGSVSYSFNDSDEIWEHISNSGTMAPS